MIGIWAGIQFGSDGEVDPESGWFKIIPFEPQDDHLIPVAFEWLVPYEPEE